MIEADAIIANLTPFRGPGADPGTVYELATWRDAASSASAIPTIPRPMPIGSVARPRDGARWTPDRCAGIDRGGFLA